MTTNPEKNGAGNEGYLNRWDVLQGIVGLVVLLAVLFSWANLFPLLNRIRILRNQAAYQPAIFVVTGAFYDRSDEHGPDYWLTGVIAGRNERLVPRLNGDHEPGSADDLLQRFPKETKIDVFYNSDESESLVQDESLRVIEAHPNLWQDEAKSMVRWGIRVFLPVPVTLGIYLAIRFANYRHRRRAS